MLAEKLKILSRAENLQIELQQSREEGKDIRRYEKKAQDILQLPAEDPRREKEATVLFDRLAKAPQVKNYPYVEPSEYTEIVAARPTLDIPQYPLPIDLSNEAIFDKVYGAWLGRSAGCLLGQPVEGYKYGWTREKITGLLKDTDNYPINYYISSDIPQELREKYKLSDKYAKYNNKYTSWINNVKSGVEDDDTNFTVLGLKLLEDNGSQFTPLDVVNTWLTQLPALRTCTAERVAYRNMLDGVTPPESATFRNPFREWIGAQIRADVFGYVAPGNPELASKMAWKDASVSHVKNGIYGEMKAAAMISAAAVTDNVEEIINAGLSQIPEKSRLTEATKELLVWKKSGKSWEEVIDTIHERYDESNDHEWCHTVPNSMIVDAALLYGEGDFEKTIGLTVMSGLDTDSNGATVGSVSGMILGARALPEKWTRPLNDSLLTSVGAMGTVKISELAERTIKVMQTINDTDQSPKTA